jgi:hypothetical protein
MRLLRHLDTTEKEEKKKPQPSLNPPGNPNPSNPAPTLSPPSPPPPQMHPSTHKNSQPLPVKIHAPKFKLHRLGRLKSSSLLLHLR